MKETMYDEGGRPFYDDDIETIQNEARASILAMLTGLGHDCIVTGCAVSGAGPYTVSPGIIFIGGQLLRYLGASGVVLPAALVTGSISIVSERTYETGTTKTCIQEQFAEVAVGNPNGLQLYPAGGFTLAHALRNQVNEVGDVKWGGLATDNYDLTGLGLPGTVAWGWGLCNGQGGRADLRGRFVASYDPDKTDYAAVGKTGGKDSVALSVDEMPNHSHPSNNRISKENKGDAGSYTAALTGSFNADGKVMSSQSAGGGKEHENRPSFYVLAARQWVGF